MTKVFVHGNPETANVWDDLVAELGRRGVDDVVRLSPPGFGSRVPDGWVGTADDYRTWLDQQLRLIGGRIDLVGHDWGAGHVFGVLSTSPSLVTTWATDCVGLLHPDYQWHDAALTWQTPVDGEASVAALIGLDTGVFVEVFVAQGMTAPIAAAVKNGLDADTARCILSLYRSAAQPYMRELGEKFMSVAPSNGLVVVAEHDHFAGSVEMMSHVATRVGATTVTLAGCGHWWMIQDPVGAADALMAHWSSVG